MTVTVTPAVLPWSSSCPTAATPFQYQFGSSEKQTSTLWPFMSFSMVDQIPGHSSRSARISKPIVSVLVLKNGRLASSSDALMAPSLNGISTICVFASGVEISLCMKFAL